jgi:hypothetical protein
MANQTVEYFPDSNFNVTSDTRGPVDSYEVNFDCPNRPEVQQMSSQLIKLVVVLSVVACGSSKKRVGLVRGFRSFPSMGGDGEIP